MDLSYVASRSLNLSRTFPVNQPVLARAPEVVINRVPLQQVRPYPRFGPFNALFYDGQASYQSLQLKAMRRFAAGLSLDINYTFATNIDTTSAAADSFQIPWQYANIERSRSSFDRTHVFGLGWVYELPFGKGKFFNGNRFISAVLGGFQINGLISAASGVPLTITQANTNLILQAQRPDVRDPGNLSGRVDGQVYQGFARRWLIGTTEPGFPFVPSSNIGIGNLGRHTSRGPGFHNWNLSVFRGFRFVERVRLEFRLEAFNAMNHVNYLNPGSTNISTAGYGLITAAAPARQVQLGGHISF
jgi:hypothetical protein